MFIWDERDKLYAKSLFLRKVISEVEVISSDRLSLLLFTLFHKQFCPKTEFSFVLWLFIFFISKQTKNFHFILDKYIWLKLTILPNNFPMCLEADEKSLFWLPSQFIVYTYFRPCKLQRCLARLHNFLPLVRQQGREQQQISTVRMSLSRFWVSMRSYKKQPVQIFLGRILDLTWLKFAVAAP